MTDNETLQKIKNLLGIGTKSQPETQPIVPAVQNNADEKDAILAEERQRIAALDAMKSGNPAVDAIVETAKKNGATAESVKPYIDAIPQEQPTQTVNEEKMLEKIKAILLDNAESGAAGVAPSPIRAGNDKAASKAANIEDVANYANKLLGVN